MKRGLMLTIVLAVLVGFNTSADAALYTFSGESNGGTGSATIEFTILGQTTLTAVLNNTSPTTLTSGSGINTPGITGFGFNLGPTLAVPTWTLFASGIQIGGSGFAGSWFLGTSMAGENFQYLPQVNNGVQGALYNPSALSGFAALPNYFTTATLTLNFAPGFLSGLGVDNLTTFVRMQNVGLNGAGSLKLTGTPGTPVPEPATMLLLGAGLAGIAVFGRRKLLS